ncbi:hypothetical protein GGS20DRAFT_585915 [Poronia punctata]|nr:hypothetical protein GGS20DRAFT_585915 [Poronia punctata]
MNTPTSPPITSSTTLNSPSELSYYSEPSRRSTGDTTPDPVAAAVVAANVSPPPSPLVDVSVGPDSNLEYTRNPYRIRPANMDPNFFQSGSDRSKMFWGQRSDTDQQKAAEQLDCRERQQQRRRQQPQQQSQPQVLRTSIHARTDPLPHRSAGSYTSANWREQREHATDEVARTQPRDMYYRNVSPVALFHDQFASTMSRPNARADHPQSTDDAGIMYYPFFGAMAEAQLSDHFAYCFDRGNGRYTRLIPADMLPPLQNIPATQNSSVGMMIVPQPRGLPPSGQWSNTEPVMIQVSPRGPSSPADMIQSRIDDIIATIPPTPARTNGSSVPSGINSPLAAPSNQRRPKIYCDKWVHEGVCAFNQQGCKYKHEMPSDKLTQIQLGLFHGYPPWWKKHQAELTRQRDTPLHDSPSNENGGPAAPAPDSLPATERFPMARPGILTGGEGFGGRGTAPAADLGGPFMWASNGEYAARRGPSTTRAIPPGGDFIGVPLRGSSKNGTTNPTTGSVVCTAPRSTVPSSPDDDLSFYNCTFVISNAGIATRNDKGRIPSLEDWQPHPTNRIIAEE